MLLSLLSSLALAAPAPSLSEEALREGLLAAVDAHFVGAEAHDGPDGCLTGLVADLKKNWGLFDAGERAYLTQLLAPWKQDLAAPFTHARPAADGPSQVATDSCFGQQKQNRLAGENFVVEWDDGIPERYASSFLTALERSYVRETDELGWRKPVGDGRYLMPAYIEAGSYQGAYTTVDSCGSGYVPYIVAYSGSWSDQSWANTMAAHEFNHAVQFSYGYAHEFWWWEATATYVEESVYDSDWWAYYVTGYSDAPQLAMNASDQQNQQIFWHMYGMAIWAFYLDEFQGGMDTVRGIWESGSGERGMYTYGQWDAFEDMGMDFQVAYLDFIVRNSAMDYAAHRILPEVNTVATVRELPASGAGERNDRPQGFGQNYVRFNSGLGEGDLVVRFNSPSGVAWAVGLVEVDSDGVLRHEMTIVDALGSGEVVLEGYGDHPVMLVVSPLDEGDTKHDYSWEAELVAAPVADAGTDDEADETVTKGSGCACATAPARDSSAPWGVTLPLAALGLVGWLRRRPRA